MKLAIEHSHTKRTIEGAFNICASTEDLRSLARQIEARLAERPDISYGWISILSCEPFQETAGLDPVGWDAP